MAKINRKELLRKPDEFQTFSERAVKWVRENQKKFYITLGGLVAAIALVVGIQTYLDYRVHAAANALSPAFQQYMNVVFGEKTPVKLAEAEKALGTITKEYGATPAGIQGRLALGNLLLEQGKWAESQKLFTELSEEPDLPAEFMPFALHGLGLSLEGQEKYTEAKDAYADAARISGPNEKTTYELAQARVLAAKGDKQAAADIYRNVVQNATDPDSAQIARESLVSLDLAPEA